MLTSHEPVIYISVSKHDSEFNLRTLLHLGDQVLVEHAASLLVKRAVDGDDIALGQHLFQSVHASATNLLLNLRFEWLVVEVEEFLAVERLESSQDTLSNTSNSNSTDDFTLKIVLVLCSRGNIPVSGLDLLVRGNEVADKGEDGHDDMFGNRHDVGASHFSNRNAAVGFVGSIEVNMVRSNTGGDCDLELLGLGEAFSGQVTGMEAMRIECQLLFDVQSPTLFLADQIRSYSHTQKYLRGGDNDFSVDQFLVKLGVFALLVGGCNQGMALVFQPLPDTELILGCSE